MPVQLLTTLPIASLISVLKGLERQTLCDLAPAFSLTSPPNTLHLSSTLWAGLAFLSSVTPRMVWPQGLCLCHSLCLSSLHGLGP